MMPAAFDPKHLCGWAGRKAAIEANAKLGAHPLAYYGLPKATETLKLWDFTKKVLGDHTPNYAQEIGDCVSFGMKNAVEYLSAVQIARGVRNKWHPVFPPYIYGISRNQIGGGSLGGGDGSLGSWAAEGVKKFGVLFADDQGTPPYSGSVASKWGNSRQGVPQSAIDLAKDNPVKTLAKVRTFDEAAQALSNGYPVTVASDVGYAGNNMHGEIKGGKCWERRSGSWGHQMCFVAVDMADRSLFCLNSWGGQNTWPDQPDGAPPGGFWVSEQDANVQLGQDDAWACSEFEGFPAQKLNHLLI